MACFFQVKFNFVSFVETKSLTAVLIPHHYQNNSMDKDAAKSAKTLNSISIKMWYNSIGIRNISNQGHIKQESRKG